MKYFFVVLAWILTVGLAMHDKREEVRVKTLQMSYYAFQSGCYVEARNLCSTIHNDYKRGTCYEDASANCPVWGEQFRSWIAEGKSKQ